MKIALIRQGELNMIEHNYDIEDLQKVDLDLFKILIKIFEQHNLTYFLSGGTLLGAVRHKGFIPWDDDIDISMPRKDYEKFLTLYLDELPDYIETTNFYIDPKYKYFITRVLNKNMRVREIRTGEITNPAVDILPLDGSPNNLLFRKIYYFKIMSLRALISLSYKDNIDKLRKRNMIEKLVIRIGLLIPFNKIFNPHQLKIKIDKNMKKYEMSNSRYSGCLMGAYRTNQMVPTEWFSKGTRYKFEDIYVNGPKDYENYLTQMYGDFMKMPSQEKIREKIHYELLEGK